MRCPKEKELLLYYYQELKPKKQKYIEYHLNDCPRCSAKYSSAKSFLNHLQSRSIELKNEEVEQMITAVKEKVNEASAWGVLKEKIKDFLAALRMGFFYRPQLIPAIIVLIAFLSIPSFFNNRQHRVDRDFDILTVEVELSLDTLEGSIFDLYEVGINGISDISRKRTISRYS